ncbi:uncharacterized protein B0H18DRAFT_974522 [Fomitopsis serialis]|uniref:uncharacterized protein n=1 Tax=Fomitopsis serialis TaxID=139415 RepID=UPI002007491E|nr:uncharacterized protein B0H18DRAFT_974522 [Neoantrodia serialis]KAH9936586.1 hypothetical protein B0H18DRAFT_974522 [Neoantrodia serialis]
MTSRLGRRIFAQAVRPSVRATGRTTGAGRRCMSSTADAAKSSDMPWIIGSAVVFGPAAVWLLTSQSDKKTLDVAFSQADRGAHSLGDSKKDAENTPESSGEDASAEPKEAEETENTQESSDKGAVTDSEGETVSGKEVNESMQQSFNEDSPPDAQAAEEKEAKDGKWTEGAPGQSSEAETKPDQKEKPTEKKGEAPSDLGDARKTAKGGEAPKESGASK